MSKPFRSYAKDWPKQSKEGLSGLEGEQHQPRPAYPLPDDFLLFSAKGSLVKLLEEVSVPAGVGGEGAMSETAYKAGLHYGPSGACNGSQAFA